ncbi:MAG: T9SS type A sorting domain-containing protein [Marinoscillum sp.]
MMQKLLQTTLFITLIVLSCRVHAQETVYIPDTNFKSALLANSQINTNEDDEIQVSEAETHNTVIKIDITAYGDPEISDLTGLEAFINVKTISFRGHPVEEIDLSNLAALRIIDLSYTDISSIDVSNNSNLIKITAVGSELTDLDISNNPEIEYVNVSKSKILEATFVSESLEKLYINSNAYIEFGDTFDDRTYYDMIFLDVSGAPNLKVLNATQNGLSHIDLSSNTELVEVDLSDNPLDGEMDFSANTKLVELNIKSTGITSLDVSNNIYLEKLIAFGSSLISLDLSGNPGLTVLTLNYCHNLENIDLRNGSNENLAAFSVYQTNLICVAVDDPAYFEENFPWSYLTYSTNCEDVLEDVVYIPDPDFKAILLGSYYNRNDDHEIQVAEAEDWGHRIIAQSNEIEDFTGIEAFVNLTELVINNNPVDSINLSTLTKLRTFSAYNTDLTSLDVSNNSKLTSLHVVGAAIKSIDLDNNPNLRTVELQQNALQYIDLSASSALYEVKLSNNDLDSIKIGTQPGLRRLSLSNNNLTSLDISKATSIIDVTANNNQLASITLPEGTIGSLVLNNNNFTTFEPEANIGLLNLANNHLTSLDFSNTTALHYLIARNNDLAYLNIRNGNEDLDYLEAYNNELTCITVNDIDYAYINWYDDVDEGVGFSTDCSTGVEEPHFVEIPDANFKAALLADQNININGDSEIQVAEAEATNSIEVAYEQIQDLTGIEAFINLESLLIGNNELTSLDLRANTKLAYVQAEGNMLDDVTFADFPDLDYLRLSNNGLLQVTLTNLPNIRSLYLQDNNLVEVDVSGMSSLRNLYVHNNELEVLNTKGVIPSLTNFSAVNNAAGLCIQLDDPRQGEYRWSDDIDEDANFALDCSVPDGPVVNFTDSTLKAILVDTWYVNLNSDNEIQVYEAEKFTGQLIATNADITSTRGIEAFINVTTIKVQYNQLNTIDVSSNTKLKKLHVQGNNLITLDLAANVELDLIRAQDNQLTSLDLSTHSRLEYLEVQNNELVSLNIHNGNNDEIYQFDATNNPYLTCVEVDDPSAFEAEWGGNVDPGASFSTDCDGSSSRVAEGSNPFETSTWKAYPNPTTGKLNISQIESIDVVEVYDVSGRKATVSIKDGQLDLSHLRAGTYLLKATRAGHSETRRIVKK